MPKSKEKCEMLRNEMKNKILSSSVKYFARNGFDGVKISDLARNIGIGQGTIYLYFNSKEDLYNEIIQKYNCDDELSKLKKIVNIPVKAKRKIHELSIYVLDRLRKDEIFASSICVMTTQNFYNQNSNIEPYKMDSFVYMNQIIEKGQKQGDIVSGDPTLLSNYYWGVVYLFALKRLFANDSVIISADDLDRTLLKEKY